MAFDDATILAVWEKGIVDQRDPAKWRKDACGAWMSFEKYDTQQSDYGWKTHHQDGDGANIELGNLYPMQWQNHIASVAAGGHIRCAIISSGDANVAV
jgi:hypothetical protein